MMLHQGKSKQEARAHAIEMIRKVGILSPEERVDNYPHEMSGGTRQRHHDRGDGLRSGSPDRR
ncbi:MAG: hypothetical protein R3E96_08660 [Planctomycetota bacterium]